MIYVLIIVVIILIMPIKVVISKDDVRSDIDIFLTKIFNIRIDFDDFLRFLLTTKEDRDKITVSSITHNFNIFQSSKNIISTLTKMIGLKKLTFIIKTKSNSLEADTWGFVASWVVFGYFQNYIHGNFKKVENEYYNHQISPKYNVNFECVFRMRIIYIIFSLIRNMKDIPKVIKSIKKGSKIYGTPSNI